MGVRNSSDFPSTLPRPVWNLTLNPRDNENERGHEDQPSHGASPLPSNTHSPICPSHVQLLRATIRPTSRTHGWEQGSSYEKDARLHGQSDTNKTVGGMGPTPCESMLRVHFLFLKKKGYIRLRGWCVVLIYALKVSWWRVFAFMVVPDR